MMHVQKPRQPTLPYQAAALPDIGCLSMSGNSSKSWPSPEDSRIHRQHILRAIEVKSQEQQDLCYVLVNGQQVYIFSEGPNAPLVARRGTLGWLSKPHAGSFSGFTPITDTHREELVRSCLPVPTAVGNKLNADITLKPISYTEISPVFKPSDGQPLPLSPTMQAISSFGFALTMIGLCGQWTAGLSYMAGAFARAWYQDALSKEQKRDGASEPPINLTSPLGVALGISLPLYGLLNYVVPSEVAAIPEQSMFLSMILGLYIALLSGGFRSRDK